MTEEYVVEVEGEESLSSSTAGVISAIWYEISGGIGPWGTIRPLFAVLWPVLYVWSIADAWWVSSGIVASSRSEYD